MKVLSMSLSIVLVCGLMASAVFAGGGAPGAHGVSGKDFGAAVSGAAKSEPGAVADHVTSNKENSGAPGAHGVSGKDFGAAVSGAANSEPGAVADHVSGK